MRFAAIDIETADERRDSACALALVEVEGRRITARHRFMLRPPRKEVRLTWIHGITWAMVANQPTFREAWPEIRRIVSRADFLAAHNVSFERSVLSACCASAGLSALRVPMLCTMRLARSVWSLRPTRLPDVCGFLGVELVHHDPLSDAEACARIALAAGTRRIKRLLYER